MLIFDHPEFWSIALRVGCSGNGCAALERVVDEGIATFDHLVQRESRVILRLSRLKG